MNKKKYYILLLGLCLIACNNQESKQSGYEKQIEITDDYDLLFQELSSETYIKADTFSMEHPNEYKMANAVFGLQRLTTNPDTLHLIIGSWVNKYYKKKGIVEKENTMEEYHQRDSIVNSFIIDTEQIDDFQDVYYYADMQSIWEDYLFNYYLKKLCFVLADNGLQNAFKKEMIAWKNLYESQVKTLDVFTDDIGSRDTRDFMFSNFKSAFYQRMKNSVLDFYWVLTNSDYSIKEEFLPLKKTFFEEEYGTSIAYVQDTTVFTDGSYSLEQRTEIVKQEETSWYELMDKRDKVSSLLVGQVKTAYDNSTYHLQKLHLIELKNEFDEYGYSSAEYSTYILDEDCSYKELLNQKRPRERFSSK